jgi:hypothetical protein
LSYEDVGDFGVEKWGTKNQWVLKWSTTWESYDGLVDQVLWCGILGVIYGGFGLVDVSLDLRP